MGVVLGGTLSTGARNPWRVDRIDRDVVDRPAAGHDPDPLAVEIGVDLVADPHREDDDGHVWTLLRSARNVEHVIPGVIGSYAGRWLARVLAWDFDVNADYPGVTLELLSVSPEVVRRALYCNRPSAA